MEILKVNDLKKTYTPRLGGAQVQALYASIAGSNIGAFLTPIGAIAGIMWMSLLKLQRVEFVNENPYFAIMPSMYFSIES